MSSTFNDEVDAYKKSKQPFTELLMATLAKQEQSNKGAEDDKPTIKDDAEHDEPTPRDSEYPKTKSLGLLALESPSLPKMEPKDPYLTSNITRRVAAARDSSEQGKSQTKKSAWDEIDMLLGFKKNIE